jgi:ribosome production factor 1
MPREEKKLEDTRKISRKILNVDANFIKNKIKRKEIKQKQSIVKNQERFERRKDPERVPQVPKMQEDMREEDLTLVNDTIIDEIKEEEDYDEFASFYKGDKVPKILITSAIDGVKRKGRMSKYLLSFVKDLIRMFPNSHYCKRRKFTIDELQQWAIKNDFTDLFIIGERLNKPYSMIFVHLPEGPSSIFRVSNTLLSRHIGHKAKPSDHFPELMMNNFNTRLGLRVSRMFGALVPRVPEFKGRRIITFHNQRDFIFIRHHRYEFEDPENCGLQEVGPQFTLRLEKLQLGLFDGNFGEYEWFHTTKMDTSRRRFFL